MPTRYQRSLGSIFNTALVLGYVTGCGASADGVGTTSEPDSVGTTAQEIRNPRPVAPGDLLGVVGVTSTEADSSCTGTAISSDTILTAAHCFCGDNVVLSNKCAKTATVQFRTGGFSKGTAIVHPDYNPSWTEAQFEHDVAIVKLDKVTSPHMPLIQVAKGYLPPDSIVKVVGRGHTGSDCSGEAGTFNFNTADIQYYEDGHDIMTFDTFTWCKGDSGGPILDAEGKQRAVISMHTPWREKAVTTGSEFDWIKSHMCRSSRFNLCDGNGATCNCTGRKDILWQKNDGQLAIWKLNGQVIEHAAYPGRVYSDWKLQGSADFNGDGQGDILWRHDNGQVAVWFMRDGVRVGEGYPGGQDPSWTWKIQGTGDFDSDGRADILWRNPSGQLAIWFEGNNARTGAPSYQNRGGPVDTRFTVRAVADFDGDTRADILWQDTTTGNVALWFMTGSQHKAELYPGNMPIANKFVGVGDFDNNLRADILWRNADGSLKVWFNGDADNSHAISYNNVPSPGDFSWQIQAIADFDHDGRDDLLWRHSSGALAIWLLLGARYNGDLYPPPVDTTWSIKSMIAQSGL